MPGKKAKARIRTVKGIKPWMAWLAFLVAGIIAGWGFTALLTHQPFKITIDLATQQIIFSAGLQLPFPVTIEGGHALVEGVPIRAWLESQGYTVTWDPVALEIIAEK